MGLELGNLNPTGKQSDDVPSVDVLNLVKTLDQKLQSKPLPQGTGE
jgi:hypothetical protein